MAEKRLIDANALIEFIRKRTAVTYPNLFPGLIKAIEYIEKFQTVDAVEVVHGRWEKIIGVITPGGNPMVRCSVCKSRESEHLCYIASTPWHYCPNCGAKMDGDGNG